MNDNTQESLNQIIRRELQSVIDFLKLYFKNPLVSMKTIPQWSWPTLIFVNTVFAALCGTLYGFVVGRFSQILFGLIIFPITLTVTLLILSGFFYYIFFFLFRQTTVFRRIFTIFIFANLPFLILYIISSLMPLLTLLGILVTGILLIVGFVENLQVPKKPLIKIMMGLFAIYFIFWIISSIEINREQEHLKSKALPESLDILQKELDH